MIYLIVALLVVSFSRNHIYSQSKRIFTLDDALFFATRNNQQLRIANDEIAIAKSRIKEARAMIFPKIDFNFNISRYEITSPFVLFDDLGSVYYGKPSRELFSTARLSAYQYLYAGGKATSNLRLARTNLLVSEANREIILSQLRFETKKAFYKLLYAQEVFNLYESEINYLSKLKRPDDSEWLKELKRELFDIKAKRESAKLHFLHTIGLELDTNFELKGTLDIEFKDHDINKLLAQTLQYRQELNKVAIQETIDALSVSLLQTERLPKIILGGTYELYDMSLLENRRNWALYLNLNLPIFDGWASWSRLSVKKLQLEQSKKKKVKIKDALHLEVRTAFINYESARKKLEYDKKMLKESTEDADRKKNFTLKLRLLASKLSTAISHTELEKAVGKDLN